jgi:predicted metal-dependent HD superfamily phosphohydrolase
MHNNFILNKVEKYVTESLSKVIPNFRHFHNLDHTLDVVNISNSIALEERITQEEIEMIKIAAWFHDMGYIICCEGHEAQSSIFAQKFLEENLYPKDKIDNIINCILSTKIPQSPKNKMEEILCDADLHHLGLPDLEEKGKLLKKELEIIDMKIFTDLEWLIFSYQFIKEHKFYTHYAKENFDPQKNINLLNLEKKIYDLQNN